MEKTQKKKILNENLEKKNYNITTDKAPNQMPIENPSTRSISSQTKTITTPTPT